MRKNLLTPEQKADILERAIAASKRRYPNLATEPRTYPCSPECEYCQGKGWFVDARNPFDRNAAHPCPNRGKPPGEHRVGWNTIARTPSVDKAISYVQNALAVGSGWVYMHGPPGRAKTLILKAVKSDPASGLGVRYTDMLGIMDDLRGAFDFEAGQAELKRRQRQWIVTPVLLIDEFDRFKRSDFAVERLYAIMDGRYERQLSGERSVTIMASNAAPGEYEDYLQSRIEDGRNKVIRLDDGVDMRHGASW